MSNNKGPVSTALLEAFEALGEVPAGSKEVLPLADDSFADLDAILAKALKQQQEAEFGKTARDTLKRGGLSREEVLDIEAKLLEWESRHEWNTIAEGMMVLQVTCTCCKSKEEQFGGFFLHQRNKSMKSVERWIAISKPQGTAFGHQGQLPKERILREVSQAYCLRCLPHRGFSSDETPTVHWRDTPNPSSHSSHIPYSMKPGVQ